MPDSFYRADARAKVTGRAVYGIDAAASRALIGGLVRSPIPRGRIVRIDAWAAAAIPGVVVITARDVPTSRYGMVVNDQPPLADRHVRFAAEPVAAVAAPDSETLAAAIGAVVVEIDSEPGVFDLEEAAAGTILVHPDYSSYSTNFEIHRQGNVCGRSEISCGDIEAAVTGAAFVVEGSYRTPRVHQGYIEPRACLAEMMPDGSYQVTTSTQNPFGVRATLCKVLAVPESRVRVVGTTVGGGFGGKLDVTLEHFACLLARKAGSPVRIVSSRAEELAAANPRENSVVRIRSGISADGRIVAREVVCLLDAGAYAHDTPFIASVATMQATGPYRIDNVRSTALAVYTNTQPTGAYRGPSGPQMVLAVEAHMDEIAARLGEDPIAFRRRHFFRAGDVALNGQVVESPSVAECLDRVLERFDLDELHARGNGLGVACAWWTTTAGPAGATARLELDGTIAIITGATEIGSGALATGVVHLAAAHLGLDPQQVNLVSTADTATGAFDFGAQGSRTTFNVGNAVLDAAESVRRQILAEAAELMEIDEKDLTLADGHVHANGVPSHRLALSVIARSALDRTGPIHASARYVAPPTDYDARCVGQQHFYPAFNSPSFHCHAAEIAVDAQTGQVTVVRYIAAQDVGKALVPPAIEGQLHGGILQGIGLALYEEEVLRDGIVTTTSFDDYAMPTVMEAPPIECLLVESASADGPQGAKGVGEPPIILPGAVLVAAVRDATGVAVDELPVTPERLLSRLRDHPRTTAPLFEAARGRR